MDKKVILVTGANGFLGRAIVSLLRASGLIVCATDINPRCFMPGIMYKQADITRPDEVSGTVGNTNVIIHVAGLAHVFSPDEKASERMRLVNEMGTANMAAAAAQKGVGHFVLISSVSVYGRSSQSTSGNNPALNPSGPYAISKYHAELRAREAAQKAGMPLTVLRLATLYGEGDPGNVARLMRALDKRKFFWVGDGHNRKSLLYKGDAARACLAVALRPPNDVTAYNVSAPPCTMRAIVQGLATALEKGPIPLRIPPSFALASCNILSGLSKRPFSNWHLTIEKWLADEVYDTTPIERDYGFRTQIDLVEGLRREVLFYRQNAGNVRP